MEQLSRPDDSERAAYGRIAAHAFAFPAADAEEWFARSGHENLRVLSRGGRVVGGLLGIPMGQYFGGRAVSMTGVAGVAVAPEARGAGAASAMMRAFLAEQRAAGVALSALYPANVPLYRSVGYERAGSRFAVTLLPGAALNEERALTVTTTDARDPELAEIYARFAAQRPGHLARGPYIWGRILAPNKSEVVIYKVNGDSGCEGYAVVLHRRAEGPALATEVLANDVVALTRRGADRLLRLLGEFGSVATKLRWYGAYPDLLTMAIRDRRHEIALTDAWMLRIVDVARALEERGYSPHLELTIDLDVVDRDLEENDGAHRLSIRDGRGVVERSARREGMLRTTINGLAALYSGYLSARTLAHAGELTGDEATLLRAEAIFAGPAPSMPDFF